MDAFARYKRMKSYDVVFPVGMDRNGLPIEVQAEKEFNINILTTPREEYISKCKLLLEKYGKNSLDTFKKLGISFNDWNVSSEIGGAYETDSPEYRIMTQSTFIELYKKGLIYESEMPSNYCTECHTTISDSEVEYKEGNTELNYIKFDTDLGTYITIATTRPELLAACKVILVNPEDKINKQFIGHNATVPIFGNQVRIISHNYADPLYGSGAVMICSYGDLEDIKILRELSISPTYVINKEGRMTIGIYNGMKIKDARKLIIEQLKTDKKFVKSETVKHRFPICWRSKTNIEFIATRELYLKQVEFKSELLKISLKMRFFSEKSRRLLEDWINSISIDWAISRSRYYGTEIPLWYCKKCNTPIIPEPGKYYRPWIDPSPIKSCPKCGSTEFYGEKRILDTWFDSSSSQMFISGYTFNKKFFEANYPVSIRPLGKEIVRSWLYFTVLKSYLLLNKEPFHDVWVNMHVTDDKGEKMSKSVGNVIDPEKIISEFGAEAFRSFAFTDCNITEDDVKCSMDRIRDSSKLLTKLWNISRFISMFEKADIDEHKLQPLDKWILSALYDVVNQSQVFFEEYKFEKAYFLIREFTWNIFADHYIEIVKNRAYGNEEFTEEQTKSALYTLHTVLKNILIVWSPMLPIVTEKIWLQLYGEKSIHFEKYPNNLKDYGLASMTDAIIQFDSKIWNKKKSVGKGLRDPINIEVPEPLLEFMSDLISAHHIDSSTIN
jgi:valyl-tRNA synthetase